MAHTAVFTAAAAVVVVLVEMAGLAARVVFTLVAGGPAVALALVASVAPVE